jgi:16S rRNA (cytidine1402-2'-O)-methyltransferase
VPEGVLYIVATPIGNLEDITLRALRVLKEVQVIACEDTRVTRKLLEAHQIATPTTSYHAHSAEPVADRLIERLAEGESVALVSDAGTPLVSDPGQPLVAKAIAAGIAVVPIPGPSALVAALSASGLPTERVLFLGFLPRGETAQHEILAPLRAAPYALAIYESPNRTGDTLETLERTLGDRAACVARELTKRFETIARGSLAELRELFRETPRGEVVILVGPPPEQLIAANVERAREEAGRLLAGGMRTSEVAKTIAGAHGLTRQEAYQLVIAIKRDDEGP